MGFGYYKDPRIEEIINNRDIVSDYNEIFKNIDEFSGKVQHLEEIEIVHDLIFPRKFNGNISFLNLLEANNLKLPEIMNGNIRINRLPSAKGIIFPEEMKGNLKLNSLTSTKDLNLPRKLYGSLELDDLTSAEGSIIPDGLNCELFCSLANNDINILKQMCKENNKSKHSKSN